MGATAKNCWSSHLKLYCISGDMSKGSGIPLYGSLMPYILTDDAVPIFGLRPDEQHTKNLAQTDMASLVVRICQFSLSSTSSSIWALEFNVWCAVCVCRFIRWRQRISILPALLCHGWAWRAGCRSLKRTHRPTLSRPFVANTYLSFQVRSPSSSSSCYLLRSLQEEKGKGWWIDESAFFFFASSSLLLLCRL